MAPVWAMMAGYVLLLASWAAASAPFTVPDEMAHYIRVLGVSTGDVAGAPGSYPPDESGPAARARRSWVNATTRSVEVPGGLSGLGLDCVPMNPAVPATCLNDPPRIPIGERHHELTPVGTYQPLFYLLPAAIVRLGATPQNALAWARAASVITSAVLLGVAAVLLWQRGRYGPALVGLLLAATPMTLYLGASINTSGAEVIVTVAFAAALLRLSRHADPMRHTTATDGEVDDVPTSTWTVVGLLGAMVPLSRAIGVVWLFAVLALWLAWTGPRAAKGLLARHPRGAAIAGSLTLVGLGSALAWRSQYAPASPWGLDDGASGVASAWRQFGDIMRQAVGIFGPLETSLPLNIDELWVGAAVVVLVGAWAAARVRHRIAILAALTAAVAVPVAFWVVSYRHTGFALQGRHFLPLFAVIPLLGGEALSRFAPRRVSNVTTAVVAVSAAVAHAAAWWWLARRYAVGVNGPLWFPGDAAWSPPAGWYPWMALTGLGTALIATAGVLAAHRTPQ